MSDVTGDGFLDMVVGTYVHPLIVIPILSRNFMPSNMEIQILTNTHTHTHTHTGTLSGQVHLLKSSVPAHALNSWSSFPNGRLNGFSHGIMGVSVPLEQRVYVTFIFFCLALPCLALPCLALPCLALHILPYPTMSYAWLCFILPFHLSSLESKPLSPFISASLPLSSPLNPLLSSFFIVSQRS